MLALAVKQGKTPVEVRDFPGFVSNRILMPMINEAIYALYEGVASVEAIDTVMKLGMNHPMGPLTLADFIGLDTCLAILNVLHEASAIRSIARVRCSSNMSPRVGSEEIRTRLLRFAATVNGPFAPPVPARRSSLIGARGRSFDLTAEQRAIGDVARDIAQREIAPHIAAWDRAHPFPRDLYGKLNDAGLMGMLVPEAYGGVGADYVSYALAIEELARVDAGTAVTVSVHSMICNAIAKLGTDEQKEHWLERLRRAM